MEKKVRYGRTDGSNEIDDLTSRVTRGGGGSGRGVCELYMCIAIEVYFDNNI